MPYLKEWFNYRIKGKQPWCRDWH